MVLLGYNENVETVKRRKQIESLSGSCMRFESNTKQVGNMEPLVAQITQVSQDNIEKQGTSVLLSGPSKDGANRRQKISNQVVNGNFGTCGALDSAHDKMQELLTDGACAQKVHSAATKSRLYPAGAAQLVVAESGEEQPQQAATQPLTPSQLLASSAAAASHFNGFSTNSLPLDQDSRPENRGAGSPTLLPRRPAPPIPAPLRITGDGSEGETDLDCRCLSRT